MVGGLVTTKLGEESLRRLGREALVKENLPYVMGTISLLLMVLATAVSSANAAGIATIQSTGSGMTYSSISWSGYGLPTPVPDGAYYHRSSFGSYFWPEVPPEGRDPWTSGLWTSPRPGRSWYNQQPVATDLYPNVAGPAPAGTAVTWTAMATDPDGDAILYKFWLKGPSTGWAWKDMTGWTASNRWTWRTAPSDAGTSSVCVSVKDGRNAGPDGSKCSLTREFTVALPRTNGPPTATGLSPSRGSPALPGASVTWTATATDPDGDQIFYRFWLKGPSTGDAWREMTGWTASNRWTWQTTASDAGTSQVNVWIRDGNHAGYDSWDSYQVRDFQVAAPRANRPPTATGLEPNWRSPVVAGSAVTWTAKAVDPDGDQIFYRFWLRGPSTGDAWREMTGWTASNRWTWQTTASDAGTSQVNVWIRDGNHAGYDSWDSYQVKEFTITW